MSAELESRDPRLFWSDLCAHARRRVRHAGAIASLIMAAGVTIAAIMPQWYRSEAVLAVLPAPEFTVREPAGSRDNPNAPLALTQIMSAEAALLASRDVAREAVQHLGAATIYPLHGPVGWNPIARSVAWVMGSAPASQSAEELAVRQLMHETRVLPARDSNVITITVRDPRASMGPLLLRAILDAYAHQRQAVYADPQLPVVQAELHRAEAEAADAAAKLAAFRRERALVDVQSEQQLLLHQRDSLAALLAESDADFESAKERSIALERQLARLPRTTTLYADVGDAGIARQNELLIDLRGRLAAASLHYRDSSALMRRLRGEIVAAERAGRKLLKGPSPRTEHVGAPAERDALSLDFARTRAAFAGASGRSAALRRSLWATASSLKQLASSEVEERALVRAKEAAESSLVAARRMLGDRRLMEAAEQARTSRVRLLQAPPPVPTPIAARLIVLAIAAVAAGGGALVVTVGHYVWRPVIYSKHTLEAATGIPVLSTVETRPDLAEAGMRSSV